MRALGRALFTVNTFPYRATAARARTRRRVEEGGGKKKTPPREGRGAHSRRHPFAKLLTMGNASGRGARTFAYGPVAPPFPPRGDTKLYMQSMEGYRSSKKITKYGTLLPEFIVRHFAARLVVLVGAAGPVEEGDEEEEEEEEEEEDYMKIEGET
ncbi:hypothetical protein ALC57_13495 [Trachymyrmex cornetzi]|uniref:Uncharacterized protein n=1 Tax=Trachymyrmex cornetzi TaxID=471704 RepID=A0A195DN77_9HYME|nr:hypothetical protein ALC57_13495 [Trachymyrmex cornetzi]